MPDLTIRVEIRDLTAAEKRAGHSLEETVVIISAALGNEAPDKGRLAGAIKAAYAEAP